jgi:hypothetical protein
MLPTPVLGLEYHRVHSQELKRSFMPLRRRWEHREKAGR